MGASDTATSRLEQLLQTVLQAGTYVAIGLVVVGSGLLAMSGVSPLAGSPPFSLGQVVADVSALRPIGFLWLGILGVLVTPAVRVGVAVAGLWRGGERRLASVGALTLGVIVAGVAVGVVSG